MMLNTVMPKVSETAAPESPLQPLFNPTSVVIIGASNEVGRVGGRALHVLTVSGFKGTIHLVNPKEDQVQGRPCHRDIADVPHGIDLAIICLAAVRVPDAIRACSHKGIKIAVVFADGFDGALKVDMHAAIADANTRGLRVVGPNTVGTRSANAPFFATFAADIEGVQPRGNVATVAQSGGLGVYFGSAQLQRRGLAASHVIDVGSEFDISSAEVLRALAHAEDVDAVGLVLEATEDGRALTDAVRYARQRGKPVVFLKTGRSALGTQQIASHTGALAGQAGLFESAMRNAGASIAQDELEYVDALTIAGFKQAPKGRRVGIVTPSGGFAILTLDAAEAAKIEIPQPERSPTEAEVAELRHGHFANPLDMSSSISAGSRALETSLTWMAQQPNIDAVIVWQAYSALRADRQVGIWSALEAVLPKTNVPFFFCGLTSAAFEEKLRSIGVLWFEEPTRLIRAISVVAPAAPVVAPVPRASEHAVEANPRVLSGEEARVALAGCKNLAQVKTVTVSTVSEAQTLVDQLESQVILKVESDGTAHKTEFGFVTGPLARDAIHDAFQRLDGARRKAGLPDAPITLQPFERGVELALGAFVDASFGPSVMVASGGIFLEIMKDAAFAPAPVSLEEAREMILGLKGAPLLFGARNKPLADVDAAVIALVELSQFIAETKDYDQIDINPLIVREKGKGAVAVDAVLFKKEASQ